MTGPLPSNVHLISFQRRNSHSPSVAVRLVHLFEFAEHPELSKPVTVDLGASFMERD